MKKIKAFLAALMMLVSIPIISDKEFTKASAESFGGTYLIKNVNSGSYLNVEGGKTANGTNVQQWGASDCRSENTWRIVETEDGYCKIYSMVDGGKNCLLNTGDGKDSSVNNICIYEDTGADNQLYKLSANSDGSFKLLVKSSDDTKAVEIVNAETSDGANVQQWDVNGVNCQDWQIIPVDYVAMNELDETVCTVTGDSFSAGDLNDDGIINYVDDILMKHISLKNNATEHMKHAANVDGDDDFTIKDVTRLHKYILTGNGELIKQNVASFRTYFGTDAIYSDGIAENTNAGFSGDAYLNLANAEGVDAVWNIYAESDGIYAVTIRYANGGNADRGMSIKVSNQMSYWKSEGKTTGAWTEWSEETLYIPLKKGVNRFTAVSLTADGAPNIDYIRVEKSDKQPSPSTPIEAIKGVPDSSSGGHNGTFGVGRQMEALDRGVVAANTGNGMLVTWRSLATDEENTTFKVYQNGTLVKEIASSEATNCLIAGASAADTITVDTYMNGKCVERGNAAIVLGTKNSGQSGAYMDIPLNKPSDQTMPDGSTCTYTPNDCSVGDVDGDGEYEIILKWDPSNSQDNSKDGYTGTVFLDCYKLDGSQLWRIDLGKNIRAGAHYTQFMVYDFDGDGKAEMMCKTSDGTVDGTGKAIGNASADYRGSNGRILTGNEYLTLFDGLTGAALDTIDYEPARGNVADWGDGYGNRVDRFLAGVAYLDGQTPSAIFCRGYYTRTAIAAYDVKDKKIVKRWMFDTGNDSSNAYYGQGNHSLAVMDVDDDGKDEIIYGSCCIDDNGKGLWSTKLGHGDCMQAGDLIPERAGLEVFQVHEETKCAEVHDAKTGEIIWRVDGGGDVGRGIALNITADYAGMEFSSVADNLLYAYNPSTNKIEQTGKTWSETAKWSMNSAVWWDGDLERENLDRAMAEKMGAYRVFTGDGAAYNNATKSNACITCDLFGDWREEMIFSANDGTSLRVFTTTFETDAKITTLMHDSQYRTGVAIENVAYNQAPNTSFFLGTGYSLPEVPVVYTIPAQN